MTPLSPAMLRAEEVLIGVRQMHNDHTERVFREAVLRECGGVMPDEMTLRTMGHIFISPDGTKTLTWGGAGNVIASVPPPRIYTL